MYEGVVYLLLQTKHNIASKQANKIKAKRHTQRLITTNYQEISGLYGTANMADFFFKFKHELYVCPTTTMNEVVNNINMISPCDSFFTLSFGFESNLKLWSTHTQDTHRYEHCTSFYTSPINELKRKFSLTKNNQRAAAAQKSTKAKEKTNKIS